MRSMCVVVVMLMLAALPATVEAQYFFENFDSYANNSTIMGQGGWETWGSNPSADTVVTNLQSHSSPNSLYDADSADIVHQFAGLTSGTYWAKVWTYVPSTQTGELFFIILNRYDGGTCAGTDCNWSVQLAMCNSGCLTAGVAAGTATNVGGSDVAGTGSTALVTDQWVEVVVQIDLDANQYSIWYNNVLLDTLAWTQTGDINIAAFDLFSNSSSESYMDDVYLDPLYPVELTSFTAE
jgi:hypothetical protein